jgi:hypothetical protein
MSGHTTNKKIKKNQMQKLNYIYILMRGLKTCMYLKLRNQSNSNSKLSKNINEIQVIYEQKVYAKIRNKKNYSTQALSVVSKSFFN